MTMAWPHNESDGRELLLEVVAEYEHELRLFDSEPIAVKRCRRCRELLPVESFPFVRRWSTERRPLCRMCAGARVRPL